jgi:hypothetical protein
MSLSRPSFLRGDEGATLIRHFHALIGDVFLFASVRLGANTTHFSLSSFL